MIAQLSLLGDPTSAPHPEGATGRWFTPLRWWLALEERLLAAKLIPRPFDLDPCGQMDAPVSAEIIYGQHQHRGKGGWCWTVDEDGLSKVWDGRVVWANPEYDAATLERWVPECAARAPRCDGVVLHVPSWTDRAWWHDTIEPARRDGGLVVWFERGRLRYGWPGNPDGIGGETAKFPSAIVIWPPAR